jgi:hypothetical protein
MSRMGYEVIIIEIDIKDGMHLPPISRKKASEPKFGSGARMLQTLYVRKAPNQTEH